MKKTVPGYKHNNPDAAPIRVQGQRNHAAGTPLVKVNAATTGSEHPLKKAYKHNNPNAKPVKAPGQSRANGVGTTSTKHPARVAYNHNAPAKRAKPAVNQTPYGV